MSQPTTALSLVECNINPKVRNILLCPLGPSAGVDHHLITSCGKYHRTTVEVPHFFSMFEVCAASWHEATAIVEPSTTGTAE
jgi:hypothetical protein